MRKIWVTALSLALLLPFLYGGCGGGGGGETMVEVCLVEYDHWIKNEAPPPAMDKLDGTYTLHSFDIDVWVDGVAQMPISSDIFSSVSGSLIISSGTISESITVEGETASYSATFTVSSSNAYYGTLHITDPMGTYDVICAIDPFPVQYDMTLQSEEVCVLIPESELDGTVP